ncbi:NADP-dependent oxidoreductase [Martelella mediterranea]|uniref:Zinc-type alcohol dehydrogenase-like protein n=1 Tax=Martelella mediterranea DSM 17316 TaxID=1122214 RepID=A0A1U9Z631_9HYPH|nr:NADP-dependent oxidoreductase [Martelella mediterranea]AQZ53080.1 Zinc-type alcohol dehydrogenase-like protein [Martelella mediterranea DSM 17316]
MKAVVITEYGSNDVVHLVDIDKPSPGAGEVLVKVHAAGVNPIDWKIRGGAGERMGMPLPIRLGGEFVGTIEALGPGVHSFGHGEAVFGMVHTGAFAEYALAKADNIVRKPSGLDFIQAAALPLAGTTAWQALFDEAGLSAGQRLLVTGGSGGVGSLAVQFAKAKGAHVTAVASARNAQFVRDLGADAFIDYTSGPFEEAASDIDVVLDTVGGESFQRAFKTLRKGGFMVTVVAFPGDEAERFEVGVKRSFTVPSAPSLSAIADLVEAGKVTPHIDTVLPLAEIRQALALSEAGRARGKIVLTMLD